MGMACHEMDIFEFLVKCYDYQANELGKSVQLEKGLFQSIRYAQHLSL